MKTFKVTLFIRAECESDAEELIEEYTGNETHLIIQSIKKVKGTVEENITPVRKY